uniref:Uncharacterized protein n=1 Tax=Setaria digitata TaxID=48799 RepID=A0A915PWY2_9BILA
MSGCFDQFNYSCDIDWDSKRNAVASCISSAMEVVFCGVYNRARNLAVVLFKMHARVNAVSNSQVRGESMNENILGTKGSRLWLMLGFVLSFASLVAALWIMFADYVLVTGDHPIWPGVALFLHNFLIFISSLVYKFGRTEELWG